MEIIKIEKKALVLDNNEKEKLIECLKYCQHRIMKYDNSGIKRMNLASFVEYTLTQLEQW